MTTRKPCGVTQVWHLPHETVRLVCVYDHGHPGEHAAADVEPIEATPKEAT